MAIILPRPLNSQPQYPVVASPKYSNAEILSLLNDGTGNSIALSRNHLIPGVAPSRILKPHGYALNFDGSTQHLDSTRAPVVSSTFTVFAWVRPDTLNTGYIRVLETRYDAGFYLGSNTGSQYAFIVNNSALEGCIGGQQVVGQRDFICGVFDNGNISLYVNGVQVGSSTATAPSSGLALRVGFSVAGGVFAWAGDIDTVGLLNRAFPASEIWSLYQNPQKLVQSPVLRLFDSSVGVTAYVLAASAGSLAISGQAATLKAARLLSAGSGSVAISGQAATLKLGRVITASAGSLAISGKAVSLLVTRLLSPASGSFAITGSDATLTKSAAGAYTLTADSGSISISGKAAGLVATRILSASSGSVSISGTAATLKAARVLVGASGSILISGSDATLTYAGINHYSLLCGSGSLSIVGSPVALRKSGGTVESFSGGFPEIYRSRKDREEYKKKKRIELGIIEESSPRTEEPKISGLAEKEVDSYPAFNSVEIDAIKPKRLIPARLQKKIDKLAEQEEINAELRLYIKLELDREEETIIRMLMEL